MATSALLAAMVRWFACCGLPTAPEMDDSIYCSKTVRAISNNTTSSSIRVIKVLNDEVV